MGYLEKEINKDMCEFVEEIKPEHFVIEGDICSHAYYIELEGTIQSTHEECLRFINSIKSALKLQQLVIDMENETGRALVDVQNWLSKEGKFSTQITNKVLFDLIKESHNLDDVRGKQ